MCLACTMVTFPSLMQKVAGSNPSTVMTNNFLLLNSLISFETFRENSIDFSETCRISVGDQYYKLSQRDDSTCI